MIVYTLSNNEICKDTSKYFYLLLYIEQVILETLYLTYLNCTFVCAALHSSVRANVLYRFTLRFLLLKN